jgi:hypothetical protein
MSNKVTYCYLGVICQDKRIPLFEDITSVYAKAIPTVGLTAPLTLKDCPGCHREHTFQPGELVQWSGKKIENLPQRRKSQTE